MLNFLPRSYDRLLIFRFLKSDYCMPPPCLFGCGGVLLIGMNLEIPTGGVKMSSIIEQKKLIVEEIADKLKLVNLQLLLTIVD